MSQDDEIGLKGGIIIIALLSFVVGYFVGQYFGLKGCVLPSKAPDEAVDAFERALREITEIRPNVVNRRTSVGGLQTYYFGYGGISRSMYKGVINSLCYGEWNLTNISYKLSAEGINETINKFCSEMCNPDYIHNETYELEVGSLFPTNEEIIKSLKID